jgi:hypothetical protein
MQKNVLTQELVSRVRQYSFMKYIGLLPNPDKVLSYRDEATKLCATVERPTRVELRAVAQEWSYQLQMGNCYKR